MQSFISSSHYSTQGFVLISFHFIFSFLMIKIKYYVISHVTFVVFDWRKAQGFWCWRIMILFILPSVRTVPKLRNMYNKRQGLEPLLVHLLSSTIPTFLCLTCTQQLMTKARVRFGMLWRLYKFKIKPCLTNTSPLNSEEKVTIFDFSDFNSSSEMVRSRWISRFLSTQHSEIFWNIPELYERFLLQFKRYLTI